MPLSLCASVILSPLLLDSNSFIKSPGLSSWRSTSYNADSTVSSLVGTREAKNPYSDNNRAGKPPLLEGLRPLPSDLTSTKVAVQPVGQQILAQFDASASVTLPNVIMPPPPPKPALSIPEHKEVGVASWYGSAPGSCANKEAPFGTLIAIRVISTGEVVSCRVDDRGPYVSGRVIDLSPDVFSKVANLSKGLVAVDITW